jgi:hypothetical protein
LHEVTLFGDVLCHRDYIGLLKAQLADVAIALLLVTVHLTGNEDRRRRIEITATYTGEQVGGTGAAGGHGHTGNTRDTTAGIGREGGSLLMMYRYNADVGVLEKRVEEMRDHASGDLKNTLNASFFYIFSYIIGYLHVFVGVCLW